MSDTIHLTNQRASVLDLLAITDVTGHRVVLQPAGRPGDARECFASVEAHPHVQTMKDARWLRIVRPRVRAAAPAADEPDPTIVTDAGPGSSPEPLAAEARLVADPAMSVTPEVPDERPIEAPSEPQASPEALTEPRRHKNKR